MDREGESARMSEDVRGLVDNVMPTCEAPFDRYIGSGIESIEADRVQCSMELNPRHPISMGRGNGGAIHPLMDLAFANASNMPRPCTGRSSTISFDRPAEGRIKANFIHIDRSRFWRPAMSEPTLATASCPLPEHSPYSS